MNFCKDCKHSALNTEEWQTREFQQKYLICTISTLDPVNGVSACAKEREGGLFSKRCGRVGRYFEDREAALSGARTAEPITLKQWPIPSGWRDEEPWFKVGDRVLPLYALHRFCPVHTITEITGRGFKYTHDRMSINAREWTVGGETFEPSGYELAASGTANAKGEGE